MVGIGFAELIEFGFGFRGETMRLATESRLEERFNVVHVTLTFDFAEIEVAGTIGTFRRKVGKCSVYGVGSGLGW